MTALAGRPLRFLIAGAANTALGLTFYPALLWAAPGLGYFSALLIAQGVCLCFAFATYKLGVFRARGGLLREVAAFASFYLANYAANWAVLPLLVEVARVPPAIAQTAFTLASMAGGWLWHSRVTFRGPVTPSPRT